MRTSTQSALVISGALLIVQTAFAQCHLGLLPGEGIAGVNGQVRSLAVWDPDGPGPRSEVLLVGGYFSAAGRIRTNNIAMWDGTTWHAMGPGVPSSVHDIAIVKGQVYVAGKVIVNGAFSYNAPTLRWDGSRWTPFAASTPPLAATSITAMGDDLIGLVGMSVFRWDGVTVSPLTTNVKATNAAVEVVGGKVYNGACGPFQRWDDDHWTDLIGSSADRSMIPVRAMTEIDGRLVVAGAGKIGSLVVPPPYIATLGPAGWEALSSTGGSTGVINQMMMAPDGSMYVSQGGTFNRLANGQWTNVPVPPPSEAPSISDQFGDIAIYNGQVYIGRNFFRVGTQGAAGIARLEGTAGYPLGDGFNNAVYAAIPYRGELALLGAFRSVGLQSLQFTALWDGDNYRIMDRGATGQVTDAIPYNDGILASGDFSGVAPGATRLATWNGSRWAGWPVQPDSLTLLSAWRGEPVVVAWPSSTLGQAVYHWNSSSWKQLGVRAMNGWILSVLPWRSSLVIAGTFTKVGDADIANVAVWDGTSWRAIPVPGGLSSTSSTVIGTYQNDLLMTNTDSTRLLRWNGTVVSDPFPSFPGRIYGMTEHLGQLYVFGQRTSPASDTGLVVARLVNNSWEFLISGAGSISKLVSFQDELVIVGAFAALGSEGVASFARWTPTGRPVILASPQSQDVMPGESASMTIVIPKGYEDVTLTWWRNGQPIDQADPRWSVSTSPSGRKSTLSIVNVAPIDSGTYTVKLSGPCEERFTEPAVLTVAGCLRHACPADYDHSGGSPDLLDINTFFADWLNGSPCADIDMSGGTPDLSDISEFFSQWLAGGC